MLQDTVTTENKHRLFVERVTASKLVWGLKSKEGWANSSSVDDEDIAVIPFWSDRAYAKACAKDDWKAYQPSEIPLSEFLESWCLGMAENDTLAGTNWDANMFGMENDALSLALEILNRLEHINSAIKFLNYSSISEFMADIA